MASGTGAYALIGTAVVAGFGFAYSNYASVRQLRAADRLAGARAEKASINGHAEDAPLVVSSNESAALLDGATMATVDRITKAIADGANSFLVREYYYVFAFMVLFGGVILALLGLRHDWNVAAFTAGSFFVGAAASLLAGFAGMRVAVMANRETAIQATQGLAPAFRTAFRAGSVMGFNLVALGLLTLGGVIFALRRTYFADAYDNQVSARRLYEAVAGFGLGGSTVALFGRVGGGIYTKAADVGADLSGKVEASIPEDDPRNPAVIADNVGDNVGDIAGMGADLFGSFAESTCAALVLTSQSKDLFSSPGATALPLAVTAAGLLVSILVSFHATRVASVRTNEAVEPALKKQLLYSTVLMTPVLYLVCVALLPGGHFTVSGHRATALGVFVCLAAGLWSGLVIGYSTDYYTSNAHGPVRSMATSCRMGAAPNVILGLAVGYNSTIVPVLAMAAAIFTALKLAGMYGIAMAALGILSTLATGLAIDAYGPICDNAGGIAEMAAMGEHVRERTDALDAAGNTTAAIGKGFAIGSAAFVSLALFGAFVSEVRLAEVDVVHEPKAFAGLLVGACLPFWFSAMTMKSVGKAAFDMVEEVRRQFQNPAILNGTEQPDYARCVAISTDASLREMVAPGLLVILSPVVAGFLFGVEALAGMLAGALISGVQVAISASNTGGAWDNAKKFIEQDGLGLLGNHEPPPEAARYARADAAAAADAAARDGSIYARLDENERMNKALYADVKAAAVIGDTIGDPLKDTSGPSLNILIKLMAIISLVLAPSFPRAGRGGLLVFF